MVRLLVTSPSPPRRGYVLLMTLVVLGLAASAFSVVALRSLQAASSARLAEEQLRRRWAVRSAQWTLGRCAGELLDRAGEQSPTPLRSVRIEYELAGRSYLALVGDEEAKVNVNYLYRRLGREQTQRVLRVLLGPSPLDIRLLPRHVPPSDSTPRTSASSDAGPLIAPFVSYGQLFTLASPEHLVDTEGREARPADQITCWGSGRLNYRTASDQAMAAVCEGTLDALETAGLLRLRRERPNLELPAMVAQLQLSKEKRQAILSLLTDQTRCFSVWMVCRDDLRTWYDLAIIDGDSSKALRFAW